MLTRLPFLSAARSKSSVSLTLAGVGMVSKLYRTAVSE
jgi:hypothetical protein